LGPHAGVKAVGNPRQIVNPLGARTLASYCASWISNGRCGGLPIP
jgi:hypothetical protein